MGRITDVWNDENLSFYAKGFYCLLAKFADKNGKCFPSLKTLSQVAGVSKPTIIKAIDELEKAGWIEITRRKVNVKQHISNLYCLPQLAYSSKGDLQTLVSDFNKPSKREFLPAVNDVDTNYSKHNLSNELIKHNACVDSDKIAAASMEQAGIAADNQSIQINSAGKNDILSEAFLEFWQEYPRKREQLRAWKCWQARMREAARPDVMIEAAKRYSSESCGKEERYIKLAATFLGANKPYEDYYSGDEENGTKSNNATNGKLCAKTDGSKNGGKYANFFV